MKQTKVGDFFIGFLGVVLLDALLYWTLSFGGTSAAWFIVAAIANLVLLLGALANKRPSIALGIVATAVFPLIAFGACIVDVFHNGFH